MTSGSRSQPGSPADPLRRAFALAIDIVIAVVVILAPLVALDRLLPDTAGGVWLSSAALWCLAFLLLYSPLSVSRRGATVGKRLLGMEVVRDADGGRLSYGAALVRHVSNVVMAVVPVFLIANGSAANLSAKKQGLHDRLVGSRVVMSGR
ncbi:RDD family protein [Streptomyces cyaneochromogenes]|uniref:RDD family protein n=2 Tax=Streptomyces cyaneochromogenes TaxID=2496836 RepID=A0A3S9MND8_9ACTN|nr:RDD family protein [Streptomyces cyaneochromogenes]